MNARFRKPYRCVAHATASCLLVGTMVLMTNTNVVAQNESQAANQENGQKLPERDAKFKELLDGATLVGHFTLTGGESFDPKPERYHLESIEKLPNGRWLFRSRIRYGDHDVTVPLPLPVEWAGDTPVIVVDNVQVPGLGTFNARVMFFDGHYAGYWSGGDHGGHLFGVVERESDETSPDDKEAE
jgi:hypothetical protein